MQNIHKVFVYGSLKRNFVANDLLACNNADFLGEFTTKEKSYKMVSLGSFPAVLKTNGKYKIAGELYLVNDECLESLDRLEGNPHLYKRELVKLDNNETAWIYLFQSDWTHFQPNDLPPSIEEKNDTLKWKGPQKISYSWPDEYF